jgi:putative ABC transport system permease protein
MNLWLSRSEFIFGGVQIVFQSIRQGIRTLQSYRGMTAAILITMIFGIGGNTAMFSLVYATLFAPPPYPHPDRLVYVWSKTQGHRNWVSAGDFADWKRQSSVFDDLNAWQTDTCNIATPQNPEFLDCMDATPGYYAMLGHPLLAGRGFRADEAEPGKEHVVILTHKLWRRLGARPEMVGQTLRIGGEPYTVVGVMAPGTPDRWAWQLIMPLAFKPEQIADHGSHFWVVSGRLRPGVTIRQAQAEMDRITAQEAKDYPETNLGWAAEIDPFQTGFVSSQRKQTLWLLLGAAGFLLLIACLNITNLLLAKGVARQRETAMRVALGARPGVMFAQFLTESLTFAIPGGILGVFAGAVMLRGLAAVLPAGALPEGTDVRLNAPVLLVMVATTALAGMIFGCAPAWHAARVDPAGVLKEGGHAGIGAGRRWLSRMLVIGELALALPLLAGEGMAIHGLWNLVHVDLGVRTDGVITFFVDSLPVSMDPDPSRIGAYYRRILAAIEATPGVSDACVTSTVPLDGRYADIPFSIAGIAGQTSPSLRPSADFRIVTPRYFDTFGIRILQGRAFTEYDNASAVKVAMVNDVFVVRFLRGLDPLRQRVAVEPVNQGASEPGAAVERQIVGVFHAVKSRGAREDNPEILEPFWQEPVLEPAIGVRGIDSGATMKPIATAIHGVDEQAAIYKTRSMREVRNEALVDDRLTALIFACYAAAGLLLATLGIYSAMAFAVSRRTREMALRASLGATRGQLVTLVVKEVAGLTFVGLGVGSMGALVVGRAMRGILFGVGPIDVPVLVAAVAVLAIAALLACFPTALTAASVEPMQFIKSE